MADAEAVGPGRSSPSAPQKKYFFENLVAIHSLLPVPGETTDNRQPFADDFLHCTSSVSYFKMAGKSLAQRYRVEYTVTARCLRHPACPSIPLVAQVITQVTMNKLTFYDSKSIQTSRLWLVRHPAPPASIA